MLRGFNYPPTPKGKSTLNSPPPRDYSSDFLCIEFWSDPATAAAVLPPELEPDPAAERHGSALFYAWQFAGANEEYLDPVPYQYREFFQLVDVLFECRPIAYRPNIFVDNDPAIGPGWSRVYPKRIGHIFQTRYFATMGMAAPGPALGSKFASSLTSGARRLAHGPVTLKEAATDSSVLKAPVAFWSES
jgi:acetoacetate decarboxylase